MAILAECPFCHKKQSAKNRLCSCGADLVKEKRSQKVKYWIGYRLPGGKQRRELVGYSIEEARDAEGKRRSQKRENRIFDIKPETKMTFQQLTDWYLGLEKVKSLSYYPSIEFYLKKFNEEFGNYIVSRIKPVDLENYQAKRKTEGKADATVDHEIGAARTMINKAFDNDIVGGDTLKAFKKVKKLLKGARNARSRILGFDEYLNLIRVAPPHLRAILTVAYHTGMRRGELLNLQWSHVDRNKGFIRLPAKMTKENRDKTIPINRHVRKVLDGLPRSLSGHVFAYNGKPIDDNFKTSLKTACKNAGVPYGMNVPGGFRFHDIRTTVKTNMLRAGVDKVLRDTILGHSLKGMDAFYLKPEDADLTRAMETFTLWLNNQMENVHAEKEPKYVKSLH